MLIYFANTGKCDVIPCIYCPLRNYGRKYNDFCYPLSSPEKTSRPTYREYKQYLARELLDKEDPIDVFETKLIMLEHDK